MIRIIAGGKKHPEWLKIALSEYEKRLKSPFQVEFELMEEERLEAKLAKWPFSGREKVILLDERGENLSSPELAGKLERYFNEGQNLVIIIGGAYGVSEEVRNRADLVLSFSRLVFPHLLVRLMIVEQIYRAQEILRGGKYHHE